MPSAQKWPSWRASASYSNRRSRYLNCTICRTARIRIFPRNRHRSRLFPRVPDHGCGKQFDGEKASPHTGNFDYWRLKCVYLLASDSTFMPDQIDVFPDEQRVYRILPHGENFRDKPTQLAVVVFWCTAGNYCGASAPLERARYPAKGRKNNASKGIATRMKVHNSNGSSGC